MGVHFPAVELDNTIWFSTLSSMSGFSVKKAALIITGAIRGTSCDGLYQEPGLESLAEKRDLVGFISSIKLHRDSFHLTFELL